MIYAGTGEENFNVDAYQGAGVLKSIDGGATWTQTGAATFIGPFSSGIGSARIGAIAISPTDPNTALVGAAFASTGSLEGIYRTTNGGTNWSIVATASGADGTGVVFDPGNASIVYAALGFTGGGTAANGIYKSTDGGATFSKLTGAALPASTSMGRIELAIAPSTTGATAVLYAAIDDPATHNLLGFFQSTDAGTTWTQRGATPDFCHSQCFYDMAVRVHPTNSSFVVVAGSAFTNNSSTLFRSTDGGATWTDSVTYDFTIGSTSVRPHVDSHALAFAANGANPPRLYVGDDGGMWRTDDPTVVSPTHPLWVDLNATLAITQFYPGISVQISDENMGYGGTQDNDTEIFSGTLDWKNVNACGDGGYTAVDSAIPSTVYTSCDKFASPVIQRSDSNGAVLAGPSSSFTTKADTGVNLADRMQFIPPMVMDDKNPSSLYFGTCRVYQTLSRGAFWTAISGDLSAGNAVTTCPGGGAGNITSFDTAHQSSDIVFAGTSNGKVWKSLNAVTGTPPTWTEFDGGLLPTRHVTAVKTKRSDATGMIAYVTFSGFGSCGGCGAPGHVFKTTNGGAAWANISGNLPDVPVNDIIVDHAGGLGFDALYIATDIGVFTCSDPEAATPCTNWLVEGTGLPRVPVLSLALRRISRNLRAGTHGRSMWNLQLTDIPLSAITLPALNSVTPATANVGDPTTAVTVVGFAFTSNTKVRWNGSLTGVTTTFTDVNHLAVTFDTTLLTAGAVAFVDVIDPGGVFDGTVFAPFTVLNPVPVVTSLNTLSSTVGTSVALTFGGTGFVTGTFVIFNGIPNFNSIASSGGTVLNITIPGSELTAAGIVPFSLFNPLPGGGSSGTIGFTILPPAGGVITLSPPFAAFGNQAISTTSSVTNVSITNIGNGPSVTLNGTPTITGTNAADFTRVAPTSGTACTFPGQVLPTSMSCTFGLRFTPSAAGNRTATLSIPNTGLPTPQTLALTGFGTSSLAVLTPGDLTFPSTAVGVTSTVINETISNGGTAALNITSIAKSGANPADYNLVAPTSGNTPCNLAGVFPLPKAGDSCDFGVSLKPTASGARPATVIVTDDSGGTAGTQQIINLSGTATGASNPVPTTTSISPTSATAGGGAFTLTVNGTNFIASSVVNFNGAAKTTTFVSATQLTAAITGADIATAGTPSVTVFNPAPGGGTSNAQTFTINNPVPTITSLAPTSATAGGAAFTLTVNGTGLISSSVVNFNGVARTTTFVNATQVTAAILVGDIATAGLKPVTVTNAAPGGGTSAATNFTVNNPAPTITSLAPSSASAGGAAFTLTINGTNFVSGAGATFGGTARTTTFVSATQVTVAVLAADIASAGSFPVVVTNPAPGGGASGASNFTVNNPAPTITSLAPTSATAGGAAFTLTVNGTNFVAGSVVKFNSIAKTTTFVSVTQVTAAITAADIATAGTFPVTVTNAAPGGGTSAATNFIVNNPAPTITTLSPTNATAGGAAFTLMVNGTNFVAASVVNFGGAAKVTTFVSATQVTAAITAGDIAAAGTPSVTVTNPAPGGGTSAGATFTINNPAPTITSLAPASATAGGAAFTLTVNGTGFVAGSSVKFNGNAKTTTFVNATQVTAAITAADIVAAGSLPVTVTNAAPGGGTSVASNFTVNNPVPTITSLVPSNATAGGAAFTLTFNGTNFVSGASATFGGAARTTTFVNATQVTMAVTAPDIATAGTFSVVVSNPAPGGGASTPSNFTVNNPAPTISLLSPTGATAGTAAFTLTVNGTGFVGTSAVTFNGNARTTTFVNATQVTAAITAADILTAGVFPVKVINPAPGGGTSTGVNFNVSTAPNPVPTLTLISPTSGTAGGAAFTLTLTGTNFISASTVSFNGVAKTTTFVNATQVTAAITAADIAAAGAFPVTVTNPAPGGGTTTAQTFTVNNPAPTITSLAPTSATAGGAAFTLTVNGTGFVAASAVKFNGNAKATTFVNATQVTAAITAADIATAGSFPVTVTNAAPGGGTSVAAMFAVNNPVPTVTTLSPTSATAGGAAFTLTVNGTGFNSNSAVNFNGSARTTTFVSATQITAAITAADIATVGTPSVTVTNPAPGGGTSGGATFTINNPAPTIASLNPTGVVAGGAAFTLTVNGTNFVATSQVKFNGTARTATFVSATQVTAAILATDIATSGNANVTVTNPAPGGGTTTNFVFVISTAPNPVPTPTSIAPTSATAGGAAFTLTVNGTNYVASSVVNFNGSARATTVVSATQLTAAITAADIATAGSFPITVFNPAPGGGTSSTINFAVNNPVPTITTLSPTGTTVGGAAFTLMVNGTGFVSGATVSFGGVAKATTFVSATQLTAAILAADIAATGSFAVTVTNPAPGGGTSVAANFSVSNPVPTISSLAPANSIAGGVAFTLTVNGTNYVNGASATFNGAARTTTFVSASQLTVAIAAADIAAAGTFPVVVTNPAPGGGASGASIFTVNNPAPAITTIAPTSATAGGAAFTLTVNGTNFVATSVVKFNGVAKTTTFVNATQVTAAIAAADIATAGTPNVTVTNPAPGGGTSAAATFTINNPFPSVTTVSPTSATAGGPAFTLTVNGTNFVPTSVVQFGIQGIPLVTTFVSSIKLTAAVPASDIASAGPSPVAVVNPAPGGGNSGPTPFTINNPVPTITSIAPTSAAAGGAAFTLTVNGIGFFTNTLVNWNGANRPTTFVSSTQLTAAIPTTDIVNGGTTATVTAFNPPPVGGSSAGQMFTINNPQPVLTSLSPASASAGGAAFTLMVNGSKFVSGAVVSFNGAAKTTTFVNATQVTAAITAADIAAGGNFNVTVANPAPSVGPSAPLTFTVNNPVPTLTGVNAGGKNHAPGGAAFTLTISGTNFLNGSTIVHFNNKPETTTFVSATQVTAAILASEVTTGGTFPVVVINAGPGGGPSATTLNFTVDSYTVSGPANTPVKAGQTGMITITVTPTANGFTSTTPVSFAVSGLPAHTTATFNPTTVSPGTGTATTTLSIVTKARGALPPAAPVDTPVSPLLRLLPILWLAAMLAGLYAMRLVRRTPQRRRYAGVVPLLLLLVTGAVLAGCAGSNNGTPAGAAQLSITATSGTMSVTTAASSVTLTVQ